MLGKLSSGDGLLLLFEAAKHVVNDETQKNIKPSSSSDYNKSRQNNFQFIQPNGSNRKPAQKFPPRSSHNELEKSRRAHLRTCMEALKLHLNFDTDATRITMLSILKKASKTIQELKDENKSLQEAEIKQKSRWNQLMKKKNHLKKRIENRRYNRKIQNWRERNRNYSECSIATTSSEDSELDLNSRGSNNHEQRLVFQTPSPISNQSLTINSENILQNSFIKNSKLIDESYHKSMSQGSTKSFSGHSSAGTSPPPFSNVYDALDGCSLDSGFEENQILTPNSSCNGIEYGLTTPTNAATTNSYSSRNSLKVQNTQSKSLNTDYKIASVYIDTNNIDSKVQQQQQQTQIVNAGVKRLSSTSGHFKNNTLSKKFHSTFVRTDVPTEN